MNYDLFTTQYYSLEVEIGRNLNRLRRKKYYNGVRTVKCKDMLLGNKIRSLRDEQGILQRQVAAYLEIDTPMFSKIERGDRRAKRSQVFQLAKYFHVDEKKMLTLWLADKILDALEGDEKQGFNAIEIVRKELAKHKTL